MDIIVEIFVNSGNMFQRIFLVKAKPIHMLTNCHETDYFSYNLARGIQNVEKFPYILIN